MFSWIILQKWLIYMNGGEGLNVIHASVAFDHDFTAWQTFEALRTL